MQLMDSHIEAGQELSERERKDFYTALIEYVAYGREPKLSGTAKAVFIAIKPVLENSRARAEAGRAGGSKPKAKRQANAKQTAKQNGSKTVSKMEANHEANAKQTAKLSDSLPFPSYSYSSEEDFQVDTEVPTLEEVEAYFGANCLRGKPDEFFDYYQSQGWRKSNGLPVDDWQAQARNWHRKAIELNAEKAARGEPEEVTWKPAETAEAQLERKRAEILERFGPEKLAEWERNTA